MNLGPSGLKRLFQDQVLVREIEGVDMVGSFHVPDNAKYAERMDRDKLWKGVILMFGEEITPEYLKAQGLALGDTVHISAESKDCPRYLWSLGPSLIRVKGRKFKYSSSLPELRW